MKNYTDHLSFPFALEDDFPLSCSPEIKRYTKPDHLPLEDDGLFLSSDKKGLGAQKNEECPLIGFKTKPKQCDDIFFSLSKKIKKKKRNDQIPRSWKGKTPLFF